MQTACISVIDRLIIYDSDYIPMSWLTGAGIAVLYSVRQPITIIPPCAGTGSLHSRTRNFLPPPQDTEQEVTSNQLDQPPWTA